MLTGWQYRTASAAGVVALTVSAVLVANDQTPQAVFTTHVPPFDRLDVTVLAGESLSWAVALSILAVGASLAPLYRPRPRRVLDTVFLAQKRVAVAGLLLASLGYFEWSHRLPRATLVMTIGLLALVVPAWFVWIRRRPAGDPERTLVVGDDLEQIDHIATSTSLPLLGCLCPSVLNGHGDSVSAEPAADGGTVVTGVGDVESGADDATVHRLGGLSRLEERIREYDVDTVVLAFRQADRAEFFGALDACHEHGVNAKVHREHADCVLVSDDVGDVVDVDVEPWDPIDHLCKRAFDVAFALVGLVAFAPVVALIAAAIKLDTPGPVLYSQDRTAGFGATITVYKFRSMVPDGETATPSGDDGNDRITRVGRVLRKTHLDELPQLLSILVGEMSVVGPRAAWTAEEVLLEEDAPTWRKRWFVKPGLTGLAQINDAKSTEPEAKLRYDLEYIRRQSLRFDLKIVIRQLWRVLEDAYDLHRR